MKKITSILMLFLMCFGMAVQAGPTDLPELTTDETNPVWYTIKNVRTNKYVGYAGDATEMVQSELSNPTSLFYFTGTKDGQVATVKIHNALVKGKLLQEINSWDTTGRDWTISAKAGATTHTTGVAIYKDNDINVGWNDFAGQRLCYWSAEDAGSIWTFERVPDLSVGANIQGNKDAAINQLNSWKQLSAVFGTKLDEKIAKINAIKTEGTFDELTQSWNTINSAVASVWDVVEGTNIRLTSFGRNSVDGHDVIFNGINLGGRTKSGDAGIWTLHARPNGFVLYNFVSNLYVKNVGAQSATINGSENENEAGVYQFVVKNSDVANLKNNGKTVHLSGQMNCVEWSHSDNEGPSLFTISAVNPIVVSRDLYNQAANAVALLPYQMQQSAGLAQSGSDYVSNYKSTQEGSYDALVDGNFESYFHSSYAGEDVAETVPAHDMTVTLSAPTNAIRFYMKKRMDNDNNKPVEVEISASANGIDFNVVKTVNTKMATNIDFMSEAIDLGITAKKVRFTVKKTNTGSKFFTLSELYIFPVTPTVDKYAKAFNDFAQYSITESEFEIAANTVISAATGLEFATVQRKATEELAKAVAVENPTELGQCSLAALSEAQTAINSAQDKAAIDKAMAKFRASVVTPVYMIVSAAENMYCTGKAAYWSGEDWHFAPTDRFNSAFWFKAEGSVETNIKNGEVYKFVNWNNGSTIFYNGTATTQAIESMPGAFNLKVDAGHGYLHAQDNNSKLVTWYACDGVNNLASAWKVEYIGTNYELMNSIPDINAANEVIRDVNYIRSIPVGAVGYYSYMANEDNVRRLNEAYNALNNDKDNVSARTNLAAIVSEVRKSESVKFDATKYYRVKNAMRGGMFGINAEGNLTNLDYSLANVNLIWKFLPVTDGYEIQTVNSGNVLAAQSGEIKSNTFQLKDFGDGQHAMIWNNTDNCYVQYGGGGIGFWNTAEKGNDHMWYLIPATELEVALNEAENATWASLYLPFDVTLPAELEAYTGKFNGSSLSMTKVADVPANNGVILKGKAAKYNLTIEKAQTTVAENSLKGTNVKMDNIDKNNFYILGNTAENGLGLYHPNATTLKANKAYLELPGGAQILKFDFNGETTGVEGVEVENESAKAVYYDLSGRRVENPAKGVYIKNGKKVYVK